MIASIQKIESVKEHFNADALDIARVLGWNIVCKRDEFKEGDLCVYIAIDSVVPENEPFMFLENKKFRVKTIKLRGFVSQGLVLPIKLFKELSNRDNQVGDDVADILGVTKYEKPVPIQIAGDVKGNFPTHIVAKTDEERIQNIPWMIDALQGQDVYFALKHDGTSMTYSNVNGEEHVCSRNLSLKESETNVYWRMYRKYNLQDLEENIIIQGEVVGSGIQKNHEQLKDIHLKVFNVFEMVDGQMEQMGVDDMLTFCANNGLETVDIISKCKFDFKDLDSIIEYANGLKYKGGKNAEGFVVRKLQPEFDFKLQKNLSFKVISNKFLLKNDE